MSKTYLLPPVFVRKVDHRLQAEQEMRRFDSPTPVSTSQQLLSTRYASRALMYFAEMAQLTPLSGWLWSCRTCVVSLEATRRSVVLAKAVLAIATSSSIETLQRRNALWHRRRFAFLHSSQGPILGAFLVFAEFRYVSVHREGTKPLTSRTRSNCQSREEHGRHKQRRLCFSWLVLILSN